MSGYKFDTIKDFNHLLLAMRELEHQQKEYTKENTPPVEKKPTPAKRANVPRKKDKNELETVVKQLMSQVELLEKRQEQLINNKRIKDSTNISTESVKAICSSIQRQPYVECLAVTTDDLASKVDTTKKHIRERATNPDEDDDDQEHVAEQQDTGIEGDDLPSEEIDTVDPVLEPDEVSETDQQVADTTLSDDTEEPGQDTTVDETVDNVPQPDIEAPWIEPRRSVRARTSTATTKYKDFIVSKKSQPQPDWKSRADYLKDIASSGTFKGMEDQILAGLLKIATEK
ncbi:unnamed protein product [Mytilus edulis]|uniref:Uncharacterized protein n=1 Tax=Mytilus edulis TaxID=6550 RepID=A0A8S3U6X1_MYTED|nr:unnamed protein product [Mytilus edulis]